MTSRSIILASIVATSVQAAPPFSVDWFVWGSGGTTSAATGGAFSVVGTLGQASPNALDGTLMVGSGGGHDYSLIAGFWSITDCPADFNDDGFVDFFDFNDFVTCFEGGACPPGKSADFNGDGFADYFDFNDFVNAFDLGC